MDTGLIDLFSSEIFAKAPNGANKPTMRLMRTECVDDTNKNNFRIEIVELEKTKEKSKPRAQSDCKLPHISSVKLGFRTNIEMQ